MRVRVIKLEANITILILRSLYANDFLFSSYLALDKHYPKPEVDFKVFMMW